MNTGLLLNIGVAAVDLGAAGVDAAADRPRANRDTDTHTSALLFGVEDAGVLQAFDGEIAADGSSNLLAADNRASQGGVAAGLEGDLIAGGDLAVGARDIVAVGIATCSAGVGADGEAALFL